MASVELRVTGDLGEMEFPAVLSLLQKGYALLVGVQTEVLGTRAASVRWTLVGLREGSAGTVLKAAPTAEVSDEDLSRVIEAYRSGAAELTAGAEEPPPFYGTAALRSYRELTSELRASSVGDFVVVTDQLEPLVVPVDAPTPPVLRRLEEVFEVEGSVVGRIEAINLHERREATLWSELDGVRVVVRFPEALYDQVHAALRQRVEGIGQLTEDWQGRPLRLKLRELVVLPDHADGPTLESLIGALPDLTQGRDPYEWLEDQRREMGLH